MNTIIFLLILTQSIAGSIGLDGPATVTTLVASPAAAAVALWKHREGADQWSTWSGKLYKIDLTALVVMEVPIPSISFEPTPPTGREGR